MNIEELKDKMKEKFNKKEFEKARKLLDEHSEEIKETAELSFARAMNLFAQGEKERAKNLHLIKLKSTDELIKGLHESGDKMVRGHKRDQERADSISEFWEKIGLELARKILPFAWDLVKGTFDE